MFNNNFSKITYTDLLKINRKIDIAIYGAGTIGRIIYNELKGNENINIIAWSDQKGKKINDTPMEIIETGQLSRINAYIMVTIINKESLKKVKKNFEKLNMDKDKIVTLSVNEFQQIMFQQINYILSNDDFARGCFIKRLLDDNIEVDKLKQQIYKFFLSGSRIRYCNNSIEHRLWYMKERPNIAYLNLAKCACTSIIGSFVDKEIDDKKLYARENYRIIGMIPNNEPVFKFTYVRNPFERLVSCYVNKIEEFKEGEEKNYFRYTNYLMGILDNVSSFKEFVKRIVNIPERWADRHFKSLYSYIYDNGVKLVDYVGKIEDLPDSYRAMQNKYNLQELKHENVSGKKDWKTYYTKEIAELVYKYYEKDILTFGYEAQYIELLKYLEKR